MNKKSKTKFSLTIRKSGTKFKTMKQILFTCVLIAATGFAAIAKPVKTNESMVKNLTAMLKNSADVKWTTTLDYNKAVFNVNGEAVVAYFNADKALIGFFIYEKELGNITNAIKKKYTGYAVVEAAKFINATGEINYYAKIKSNKRTLVLEITPAGKTRVYANVT
jgi:hypothetical protein